MPQEINQELSSAVQQAIADVQSGSGRQFSSLDQTMLGIVRRWGEARLNRLDLMNQAGANLIYNHGKHTANLLGLTEAEKEGIVPFPGSTSVVVLNPPAPQQLPVPVTATPVPSGGIASSPAGLVRRLLAPVLAAGAIGTGAGVGVSAIYNAITANKPVMPPAIEDPIILPPVKEGAVGLEIR